MTTAQGTAPTSDVDVSVGTERWVLLATILASSMAFIDGSALNVALPTIQRELNVTGTQLFWIVNAYALFLASLILVGGSLGDHYGRKRVFMIGIGVFSLSSLACGLSPNIDVLIAARAVQGIGGALMVPGSLAILSASVSGARRGVAIGTWSTFSSITTLLGPVLGGWLSGLGFWRGVFFVNLPLALIALIVLILKVPESRDTEMSKSLDIPGVLLATLGLASITYGFIEGPNFGLTDPRILITLIGGAAALIIFVIVESRTKHPMVLLSLFRSHTFSGTNALTLLLYAALGAVPFFLLLNLVQVQGYPEQVAGFTFLPLGLIIATMSRFSGGLVDRIGPRLMLTVGPAIAGVGFLLFAIPGLTNGPSDYWITYFPAIVTLAFGMGLTVAPLTTAVMNSAPSHSSGTASGINNAVARTAGVLAIAIVGAIALFSFNSALTARTDSLNLPENARAQLRADSSKLADTKPPADLSADLTANVQNAIKLAYIDTFRLVALIGAGLAWTSALLAALLVEGRPVAKVAAVALEV
ncbi:MAG: MFS transporter [Chloroflexota bacterium]